MTKSKLYTRTGDKGMTSLADGSRIAKTSARIEAYGTIDELNSFIGALLASQPLEELSRKFLTSVQLSLFDIGGYLATDATVNPSLAAQLLPDISRLMPALEAEIDRLDSLVPPMKSFVLPAGSASCAATHVCRTVCRRAERRILTLQQTSGEDSVSPEVIAYVNRLSDYFFILARFNNHIAGNNEIIWHKSC